MADQDHNLASPLPKLPTKLIEISAGVFAPAVAAFLAGTTGTVDREPVFTAYRVKTAFTGASVGDTVTATRILDVSGAVVTQLGATLWYNETTAAALASAPSAANLELVGSTALT